MGAVVVVEIVVVVKRVVIAEVMAEVFFSCRDRRSSDCSCSHKESSFSCSGEGRMVVFVVLGGEVVVVAKEGVVAVVERCCSASCSRRNNCGCRSRISSCRLW